MEFSFFYNIKNIRPYSLQRIRWVEWHMTGKVAVVYIKIAKYSVQIKLK
jgi:hypothetical protein